MEKEKVSVDGQVKKPPFNMLVRVALIVLFAVLTLPILPLVAVHVSALGLLLFADLALRAVPLYLAYCADQAFYDAGELSPELMPLWIILTGLLLWPLVALAIRPALWQSRSWRKALVGYVGAAVAGTVVAAFWVFTHLGAFF